MFMKDIFVLRAYFSGFGVSRIVTIYSDLESNSTSKTWGNV